MMTNLRRAAYLILATEKLSREWGSNDKYKKPDTSGSTFWYVWESVYATLETCKKSSFSYLSA